ncbi:hypothetical protein LTR94_034174, partial [Friedmanniomyces endolithicus]
PIVSASAPISSEKLMPPIHAADPAMPPAVATTRGSNRSAASVISAPDNIWCANPPMQNNAIAAAGDTVSPMHAGPTISKAPVVTTILREVSNGTLKRRITQGA